jgi:glycosyltransferase involved in cell wall biosynthesis/GT2 family glycosyltransferase
VSLRVLLALHHRIAPGGGAPGATLALGDALTALGCRVDYFGYDQAFGPDSVDSIGSSVKFPWELSAFLKKRGREFDVLDVSTGDAWAWASFGRSGGSTAALVTRSHGLEQTVDRWQRQEAAAGKVKLSWKYPLYHGGYRLWEVRRSMKLSDHCLLLNPLDKQIAVDELGIPADRISLVENGIGRQFLGLPRPVDREPGEPLRMAAIGTWIDRKGKRLIVDTAERLQKAGVPFSITLLGTGADEVQVRGDFSPASRHFVKVVPKYKNEELPALLAPAQVLLALSFTEGYALALPEGMACGLAPVATDVGAASLVVRNGDNGSLIPSGNAERVVETLTKWAADPAELVRVRTAAQASVQRHGWEHVAAKTIDIYESVLSRLGRPVSRHTAPAANPDGSPASPRLSICICTANRPAVLRRCLLSIESGEELPFEVVVGDDTLDGTETAAVCRDFPFVRYVRGPRWGLCANRNVVIAAAKGDYLSLLDDDGEVTPTFVKLARQLINSADGRTIFTGDVLEDGTNRVAPSNPTFWGHFGRPLAGGGPCETVQLNCNLFPRSAFDVARFDERIVYGYEDMDLCQQMLAGGHRIEYRPELVNLHLPPPKSADTKRTQTRQAERARYYTSLKRYMLWQSKPGRAVVYAALAPLHQAAHHLAHWRMGRAVAGFGDMTWAVARTLEFRRTVRTPANAGRIGQG